MTDIRVQGDYTAFSVSAVTGGLIAELPGLVYDSLPARLMEESSASFTLPLQLAPDNWLEATAPYAVCVVVCHASSLVPVWGGVVVKRSRTLGEATVALTAATCEHYLKTTYVLDESFSQVSQTLIAGRTAYDAYHGGRWNALFRVDPSETLRDRTYLESSDHTTLEILTDLTNVIGGPEFAYEWMRAATANEQATTLGDEFVSTSGMFAPVLHVSDRLGAGTSPSVVFRENTVAAFSLSEDWSEGKGASNVFCSSTAEGDSRLESGWVADYSDTSRPYIAYKFAGSDGVTNVNTLRAAASAKLEQLKQGTTTLSLSVRDVDGFRPGVDYRLGDVIAWDFRGVTPLGFPDWEQGSARLIGWTLQPLAGTVELDLQNITKGATA